jgi:hypothetical protein
MEESLSQARSTRHASRNLADVAGTLQLHLQTFRT